MRRIIKMIRKTMMKRKIREQRIWIRRSVMMVRRAMIIRKMW